MSARGRASRNIIAFVISGALLYLSFRYIYVNFQWHEILRLLAQASLYRFFVGGTLTIILYWFLRTLRWHLILRRLNIRIPVANLYLCTAVSLSLAILTPMQSGEALKVELLKKMNALERVPAYSSFALERYLDLCAVVLLALISLSARLSDASSHAYMLYLLSASALLGGGLFLACRVELRGRIGQFQSCLRECIYEPATLLSVTLITLLGWGTVAWGWQVCLQSLSIDIQFRDVLSLTSIMTIVNILSFIPGAVGISEAGIAESLIRLGRASATAQAGALFIRFYGILIVILGVLHLPFCYRLIAAKRRHPVDPGCRK